MILRMRKGTNSQQHTPPYQHDQVVSPFVPSVFAGKHKFKDKTLLEILWWIITYNKEIFV